MEQIAVGVDLGGTKLSAALFRKDGGLIAKAKTHDHVCKGNDETMTIIAHLVKQLLADQGFPLSAVAGIGVGLAGHVLYRQGMVITTSNFKVPFVRYPLTQKLGAHFPGTRVLLDNDANAQALGEYMFGAGRGCDSMVFMTISTGIGAGIVLGGRMWRGRSGTAGEIGHSIVDIRSTHRCTCGNYGCAMALSSGLFLPELYAEKLRAGMTSCIDVDESNVDRMCGELLEHGMKCRDEISLAVIDDSADVVGTSVFNVFQLLNPDVVVLGGGLMKLGDYYLNRIRSRFQTLVQDMMYEPMDLRLSETGDDTGLLGASALVWE